MAVEAIISLYSSENNSRHMISWHGRIDNTSDHSEKKTFVRWQETLQVQLDANITTYM